MNPEPTHTPGPWQAIHDGTLYRICPPSGNEIATVWDDEGNSPDAHLIASAPDMLEALKEIINEVPREYDAADRCIAIAKRAINKASNPNN